MNQLIKEYVCAYLADRYTPDLASKITDEVIMYGQITALNTEEEIDFLKETIVLNASEYLTF